MESLSPPIKGAFALIFSEDRKKVLMILRRDLSIWEFPGGGLEIDETPEKGVVREVEEETGFKAKVVKELSVLHLTPLQQKMIFFECSIIGGTFKSSDETVSMEFFPLKALPLARAPLCSLVLKTQKEATVGLIKLLYLSLSTFIRYPKILFSRHLAKTLRRLLPV